MTTDQLFAMPDGPRKKFALMKAFARLLMETGLLEQARKSSCEEIITLIHRARRSVFQ
jgi:hypothetical protein